MKILVAEDDPVSRHMLEYSLRRWGYEVTAVEDGAKAWEVLQNESTPQVAILDWQMPGMDGTDVCRLIRSDPRTRAIYVVLLTTRSAREDKIRGLQSGADDYVTKPFDRDELRARVQVGMRVLELQGALAQRVRELEEALSRVNVLQGLLPICSYCKKIRNDGNYWQQVEGYISEHTDVQFSHGICPECYTRFVQPQLDRIQAGPEKRL